MRWSLHHCNYSLSTMQHPRFAWSKGFARIPIRERVHKPRGGQSSSRRHGQESLGALDEQSAFGQLAHMEGGLVTESSFRARRI